MVSEVNMVSGLATGPAAALTQMRNGPVPVPSAFGWRSPRPGPGIPLQARSLLWHTRPAGPGLYFQHTRATAGVEEETCSALFGEGRVTGAAGAGGAESAVLSQGFLGCCEAQGTICRRPGGLHPRAPAPWSAATSSPVAIPAADKPDPRPGPAAKHPSTNMRFPSALSLSGP